jgi:hypothetical protein
MNTWKTNSWKTGMAGLAALIRSTIAQLLGEDDDSPPCLPAGLSDAVKPIVIEAVHQLVDYQSPSYAQLYLDRLKRFVARRNVGDALLVDIAQQLAARMSYEDPIRMAQLKLGEVEIRQNRPQDTFVDDVRKLRLDEMVASLPGKVADPVLAALEWAGWLHMPVVRRFSTESRWSIRRLKIEASLRRWRLYSVRYAKERVWVERWLHMIDRSLIKQPEAVFAVVETATLVQGYGHFYRLGLAEWHLIIDGLVKPTLDGPLKLKDLAGAIVEARAAAMPDPRHASLKRTIAVIRARASAGEESIAAR